MRFRVLASDYDGTLVHHGRVDAATVAALQRRRASGRQLVLVTGRYLYKLPMIVPEVHLVHASSPRMGPCSTGR
jgi:HAD superfamily hydrolase (TIGR01484 family)